MPARWARHCSMTASFCSAMSVSSAPQVVVSKLHSGTSMGAFDAIRSAPVPFGPGGPPDQQISLTDPDARSMATSATKTRKPRSKR